MVAAISVQAANGLGKKEMSLSKSELTRFEKVGRSLWSISSHERLGYRGIDRRQAAYATDFLYITTLIFSKSTLVLLLRCLTPVRSHQLVAYVLAGALGSWALSGLLTVAFQCSPPRIWAVVTGICMNQVRNTPFHGQAVRLASMFWLTIRHRLLSGSTLESLTLSAKSSSSCYRHSSCAVFKSHAGRRRSSCLYLPCASLSLPPSSLSSYFAAERTRHRTVRSLPGQLWSAPCSCSASA